MIEWLFRVRIGFIVKSRMRREGRLGGIWPSVLEFTYHGDYVQASLGVFTCPVAGHSFTGLGLSS